VGVFVRTVATYAHLVDQFDRGANCSLYEDGVELGRAAGAR
jgi:hypothetical protein